MIETFESRNNNLNRSLAPRIFCVEKLNLARKAAATGTGRRLCRIGSGAGAEAVASASWKPWRLGLLQFLLNEIRFL